MRSLYTLAAATLALTSTAALADGGERRFVHQGSTYVYTTAEDHGRTVISGRRMPGNDSFHLIVDGKRVTGTSGGSPVSFPTASAKGAAGGIAIAAN